MERFLYEISGRRFTQRRLVWGQFLQVRQLFQAIKGRAAGAAGDLIDMLGPQVPRFAAIVLCEEGKPLAQKDLEELTAHIEEHLDAPTAVRVVSDFLECTPIASDLSELTKLAAALGEQMAKTIRSSASSAPSPEETSPEETPSSGDTPPKSPAPTSEPESGS